MSHTVTVKYKTVKNLCSCCWQKLPIPKESKELEFEISKEVASHWADWEEIVEYPEDIEKLVPEYVHDTISFHATHSEEKILIQDSEIAKVKEFILREFGSA
ncbi:hypothetical protein [Paenibacillus sp. L3-i20]|uniref:hypothetical protein n=1 Tax=Paenibacillus sp. L3-i20 TaxID=2905833 RepID=UPI001EDE721E|nr:hypothetical protein [Paenibacillus sp. L3-i20]GKU79810.1 hypothetical protein L3i20_v242070 [Paenibacillus sp. L3-i20]